jgi:hypothetical protein
MENLIRKDPIDYTKGENEILAYEQQVVKFLPKPELLVGSQDPPSLFPLAEGSYVLEHSHEHIGSAYVASVILKNSKNDGVLVWSKGSKKPTRLVLTPGSLLLMTGNCRHCVEKVAGELTVLAFDFCYAR